MNFILFDDASIWEDLLPLTYTKPISKLRVGILTIQDKWEILLKSKCSFKTRDYLSEKYPCVLADSNVYINSSVIANKALAEKILKLSDGEVITQNEKIVAAKTNKNIEIESVNLANHTIISLKEEVSTIQYPWDIFLKNGEEIKNDINHLFKNKTSEKLSKTNNIIGEENIYVEEGVKAEFVTINASNGPVYLGKNTEVMEGAVIRGPFALCESSTLKLSAKVYGPVTIGPHSKVGGEISESVIQGYSNKAHDGYLGNSVIGEWCNLGADTNTSNLKNNYEDVKVWNYNKKRFIKSGLQFCGLIMGDHSKCGINTMFNTGTIVGVSANIFGSGFPRNFIPSFSWGGAQGYMVYKPEKAYEVAKKVMARRKLEFKDSDIKIMNHIFQKTEEYRKF